MLGNPTLFHQAKSNLLKKMSRKDKYWQNLLKKYWEKINIGKNYWKKYKYWPSQLRKAFW